MEPSHPPHPLLTTCISPIGRITAEGIAPDAIAAASVPAESITVEGSLLGLVLLGALIANYANPLRISRAILGTQSKVQNSTSQLFLESPAWVGLMCVNILY